MVGHTDLLLLNIKSFKEVPYCYWNNLGKFEIDRTVNIQ